MKRDGIASWTTLIQSENEISKNGQLESKVNKIKWTFYSIVGPCFNEPLYNKVLGITSKYIPSPGICKIYEKNLDIVKPSHGKYFYCPLLSPSLHPRFHCNTAYIVYMYHVSCSPLNTFTLGTFLFLIVLSTICSPILVAFCWRKYIFSQLVSY